VTKIAYFDYLRVAKDLKVPDSLLREIENETRADFPQDEMMYELHVMRAIKSRYWHAAPKGRITRAHRDRRVDPRAEDR
jgi:hypothetical protein